MHTPWLLRGIHAVIVVVAMTAFGTALFCVAASTGLQINQAEAAVTWICLALPWLVLLASVWGIWKRLRYAITLPLLGVSSAFVIYMAWDDPSRPPAPTIDALVPADSKSYAAYQRFVKDPASADLTSDSALPLFPGNVADWPAFVIEHRTQLEDAWEADTSGQSWIIDMAENKPEGLYPPETYNAPGLSFFKVRSAAQLRWAKFHLLVADGQPNEAAQLLLPLLRASHHLQSAGTTLLNQMIPVVLLKGCYQRMELLADDPGLAAATRAELLAALNEAPSMNRVFANAFLGEEFFARSVMDTINGSQQALADQLVETQAMFGKDRNWPPFFESLPGRMLFHPNRTEREFSEFLKRSCELLQKRQLEQSNELAQAFETDLTAWHLKNPLGRLFSTMALPSFQKLGHHFWQADDQRVALIERLKPVQ